MPLPNPSRASARPLALAAALVGLVAVTFARVGAYGFVNLDDPAYVTENATVLGGLSWAGLRWAFGVHVANWHPLTWVSHMLDVELFGARPGPAHLVNVALHAANAALLFELLRRATGATFRSAAVAALFAVHPLHVESVAWISERKDVLSTLFLLLSLRAYLTWASSGRRVAYAAALGAFALGLLSKPMVVTLPFLLLLLEVWPLGRIDTSSVRTFAAGLRRAVARTAPFFLLSAAACVATFVAQTRGGGDESALSPIAPWPRVANAVVAYVVYLARTAWPAGLAAFYPHPATVRAGVDLVPFAAAGLLLVAVTVLVVRQRTVRPYLPWGWCWYVGTLVPVIGLVQVGGQASADRYTYVPLIGIFVAGVWAAAEGLARARLPRWAVAGAAALAVAALSVVAGRQASYWRDSVTLHRRALAVTDRNWKAWQGLCEAELSTGRLEPAVSACTAAVEILPSFPEGWQTLGVAYARLGRVDRAIPCFARALELRPDFFNALSNLGSAFANSGSYPEAVGYFQRALALRPESPEAWAHLGLARWRAGDRPGALEALRALAALDPARADWLRARLQAAPAGDLAPAGAPPRQ